MATYSWGVHPEIEAKCNASIKTYGPRYGRDLNSWLRTAAFAAAKGVEVFGYDPNAPEELKGGTVGRMESWGGVPNPLHDEPIHRRLLMLISELRTGNPPFELWVAEREFYDIASSFDRTIKAMIIVNHHDRVITLIEILDLPGV